MTDERENPILKVPCCGADELAGVLAYVLTEPRMFPRIRGAPTQAALHRVATSLRRRILAAGIAKPFTAIQMPLRALDIEDIVRVVAQAL